MRKGTRHVPIIFVAGDPEKVEKIMDLLPDASYCNWDDIVGAVKEAVQAGTEDPVVPDSAFAAYAGKPLVDKLGVKAGSRVALVDAPSGFAEKLGELPEGAVLVSGADEGADLAVWFVPSGAGLLTDLKAIVAASKRAPVWIAWPKGGAAAEGDLTQQVVRETLMAAGLVDYKICSIDRDWSGLLFTWRGFAE
jgi:hypothetical protein